MVAQSLHSGDFFQRIYLSDAEKSLHVPKRAWSGYGFQNCYSLKSVEQSESQTDWPWSIRHCAVHHSFDVENVRSTWVVVKGNRLLEKRIASATSGRGPPEFSSYGTIDKAFAAALATHLLVIEWSAENWRCYINFLEEKFEKLTQGAISSNADVPIQTPETEELFALASRTNTQATNRSQPSRTPSPKLFRNWPKKVDTTSTMTEMQPIMTQQFHVNPRSGKKQPLPPGRTRALAEASEKPATEYDAFGQRQFRFRHLQDTQDLEERTNETLLVLKMNSNICRQISAFYQSLFDHDQLPKDTIKDKCQADLHRFVNRTEGLDNQMSAQKLRVEALLRLVADRKTLVRSNRSCLER